MSFKELKKIKIAIVAGGWSSERSVSINSGKNVFNTLKKNGYKVTFFDLKKYNLHELFKSKPDLIFNALHGEFGEDGGISCLAKKYNTTITHSEDISGLCSRSKAAYIPLYGWQQSWCWRIYTSKGWRRGTRGVILQPQHYQG